MGPKEIEKTTGNNVFPWRKRQEKRTHYELCALILQVITCKCEEATVELRRRSTLVSKFLWRRNWGKRTLGSKKVQKISRGSMPPAPLWRSFNKSVRMYPRSAPGTCPSIAWEVGHLMLFPSPFESQELSRWMNHWKRHSGSDYESSSLSSRTKNTAATSSSRTFSPFCLRNARRRRGHFLVFEGFILGFAIQWPPNDSQVWPSSSCMQMQLPSIEALFVRNLWRCTLDE